jgi:ABC-type sulfate transport system substrate-binding protein
MTDIEEVQVLSVLDLCVSVPDNGCFASALMRSPFYALFNFLISSGSEKTRADWSRSIAGPG